jgi:penicillin-binding protein 1A
MASSRGRRIPRSRPRSEPKRARAAAAKRRFPLGPILLWGFALLVLAGLGGLVYLWPRCSGDGCPSVEAIRTYAPPQASRVFDGRGQLITHLAPERRIVIPIDRIPAHVAGAFLAVEDRRFFQHRGIDFRRVAGAAFHDLRTFSFDQGFSTITMQLARNLFPEHLTRAKTLRRKVWEIVLAVQIEREFSKREILEMYLNQIYLGEGAYGVEAAAQGYYGKTVSQLDAAEAAMLAALPKAPSTYNPRQNPLAAVRRRNLVLGIMSNAGVVSPGMAEAATARPLGLATPVEGRGEAPYFIASVRRELRERFGDGAETAGYRVYTALDRQMQRSAVEALARQLAAVEKGEVGRFRGPNCSSAKPEDPATCLQGLFVAVDNRTGNVLALVGGRDFAQSQFDRATQARRQAGSAFKPFVFATALASGIPINTTLLGPGAADYEGGYRPADHVSDAAAVDLREAMRLSSNRAAVALGERVGVGNVVRTARVMGITTPMQEYPSTVLGAAEVVPIELVGAYTAFANAGVAVTPRLIQRVEDANGRLVWEAQLERLQVISPQVAYLTTSLLEDVVASGTGARARSGGLSWEVPAAGKTGTTNDAADAWFIGYTPEVTAGVWIGFDRRQRIAGNAGGGNTAAPVWGRVMADYYRTRAAPRTWSPPLDLIRVRIDRETGELATSGCPPEHVYEEWFIPGTEPRRYCSLHYETTVEGWVRRGLRGIEDLLRGRRP